MSAGPVTQSPTNIPGANKHTNNVLTEPPKVVHVPRKISTSSSVYQHTVQNTNHDTDGKSVEHSDKSGEVDKTDISTSDTDNKKVDTKTKREEWSALEEARKVKREAEELYRKAEKYNSLKSSPTKLASLAESLGIPASDLLLQLQNEALAIPTTKPLTAEEQKAQEAKLYKETQDKVMQDMQQMRFETVKMLHINKAILPHLIKEPETFEFCHKYGVDKVSDEVYNYCNKAYQQGEKLNEREVLEEFENRLFERWQKELEAGKTTKKAQKYFTAATKPEKALGANQNTLEVADELAAAMEETPAKRLAPRKQADLQAKDKMAEIAAKGSGNKLNSGVNPSKLLSKEERRRRTMEDLGIK